LEIVVFDESMILTWMVLLPVIGAAVMMLVPAGKVRQVRGVAMGFVLATFALSLIAAGWFHWGQTGTYGQIQLSKDVVWISSLNVHYYVGVDGLSMPLVLLTTAITVLATYASFSIEKNVRGYFILLMLLLAGMLGVFISLDLMLFYVFFEVSLFPMYFLIGIWGGPKKEYAAIKFFLYTLVGSVGMLVAIIGLYQYTHTTKGMEGRSFDLVKLATNEEVKAKFDPNWSIPDAPKAALPVDGNPEVSKKVMETQMAGEREVAQKRADHAETLKFASMAFWLLLVGFAVKVPVVPLHTWLPDAHVEAPTPISMILAAVLLKMGGYGMMRVLYPLFPHQGEKFWFWVALIGVVSCVYGALCAMAQKDFKKLVAYSSVSHMGYVTLGIAVMTPMGFSGAMFQMIAHGISSAMMFYVVGVIYERAHHRDIPRLGGIWSQMPTYTGWATVGVFASMGLPGLCGFVGELLVLLGVFDAAGHSTIGMQAGAPRQLVIFGVIAALTVILTAAYLLWVMQRVYMGAPKPEYSHFSPLNRREKTILATLGVAAVVFGVVPMIVLGPLGPTIESILNLAVKQ
jgi:NADH-quinone oxidoreductase subunit M